MRWTLGVLVVLVACVLVVSAQVTVVPAIGAIAPVSVTSRFISSGTTPTVANVGASSCGTTSATIAGNETSGIITVGATAGTQCRITFATAAATRRECMFEDETTKITILPAYVDTTHSDVSGVFVAGDVIAYMCFAR